MKTRSYRNNLQAHFQPRLVAELNSENLRKNFQSIHKLLPGHLLLPMVKANGYGHDAEWMGRLLCDRSWLYGFGVATLEEGGRLRAGLGPSGSRIRIFVFSGTAPWSEEKGLYCEQNGLTPVIASDEDWKAFLKGGWPGRIPFELKFNTGMNRLGLGLATASSVAKALGRKPSHFHPTGILSHLAVGENPGHALSVQQREQFIALKQELAGVFPNAKFHLANSAGIWNRKEWGLEGLTDVARPGLSVYGITPWQGAPAHGISPVMTVKAHIVAIHELKAGESVGYGGTYKVPKSVGRGSKERVAILAAGYADGIHRMLSNCGTVWIRNQQCRVLGTVAMDLCAVSSPPKACVGDWAELIGCNEDLWTQAKSAGTIPYELLTSVSGRVQRVYV